MSLKEKTLSAVAWSTVARVGQQSVQIGLSILLARLLAPEAYGIIGMVLVFMGFASLLGEFGFGAGLVQRRDLKEIHLQSILWVNLVVGLALTSIFFLAAPLLAGFYSTPILEPIAKALSLNFTLVAVGIVPTALLERRMDFQALAKLEIIAAVIAGAVAMAAALHGMGVWSLVIHTLTASLVGAALASWYSGWRPRFQYSHRATSDLLAFSANLFGFTSINYWARNADNLLIGRFLGASALGVYSRAYSLMLLPMTQVIGVISRVMFPALSSIQTEVARVRDIYLRAMSMITLVTFPIYIGLFVVAEEFVLTLLGPQWIAVAPILRVLSLVGIVQSMCGPVGWIYTSQGRTDWMFRWGVAGSGTLVVAIIAGTYFGSPESVAWAYLVGNLLAFYPCIAIPGKLIGMSFREVLDRAVGPFACAVLMGATVWVARSTLPVGWPSWLHLAGEVVLGTLSYGALVWAVKPAGYREIEALVLEYRERRATMVLATAQR